MRILIVHNSYQQAGGEDVVVESETKLLADRGHVVVKYHRSNQDVLQFSQVQKALLPVRFVWANDTYQQLRRLIQEERPDIAHFHNTHFMVSPAAYYVCKEFNIPVVQTVHNYRIF